MVSEQDDVRAAMLRWSETLDRDDIEGDPRDLVRSAYAHAWTAGRDAALADRAALEASNREMRSLLECTQFALEWLILHHVIEDGGKDWKSKFDGSAFFACDCSENSGYMEWDTNAYIHTEHCASGFEDSLGALLDQVKAALAAPAERPEGDTNAAD